MPLQHQLLSVNAVPLGSAGPITVHYFPAPDQCPQCHVHTEPKYIAASFSGTHPGGRLELAFQCTRRACGRMIVATYEHTNINSPIGGGFYHLSRVAPVTFQSVAFPEVIGTVSPTFVTVYNQALGAEAAGFDQLTGIGLRKALEFLVKDFAILKNSANVDGITKVMLGQCINTFIDDANVKKAAARAAWLGNDETHYIRKWTDKDVNDLKLLVRLTANWIENVLLTEKYEKEMPDGVQPENTGA